MGRTGQRRAACLEHIMRRAVVEGWFVCVGCGVVAVCPGCVSGSSVRFHFCKTHRDLAAIESYGSMTVWASRDSSR